MNLRLTNLMLIQCHLSLIRYKIKTFSFNFLVWPMVTYGIHLISFYALVIRNLEKEMTTHSSILAWRSPGTEEPGRLLSMGSHRVRHY